MEIMLKITTILLFWVCLSKEQEEPPFRLDLIATPQGSDVNLLELRCFDPKIGQGRSDAFFWLNGTSSIADETHTQLISGNIHFIITPELEGDYTCGIRSDRVNVVRSDPVRLVAFPAYMDLTNVDTFHPAASGSTARLPCAIQPGKLVTRYMVQWSTANGVMLVEFQFGITRANTDPDRYSVDPSDLSLLISNVAAADAKDYVCVLSVDGAGRVNRVLRYEQTLSVNITLEVFDPPEIRQPPMPQVVSLPENTANSVNLPGTTFQCTVSASEAYGTSLGVVWLHKGQDLQRLRSSQYNIMTVDRRVESGVIVITSQLDIESIGINDNGIVTCEARIPPSKIIGDFPIVVPRSTTLTVLGGFQNIQISITQDHHVLFDIPLHSTIPTEVRLQVEYTPTNGNTNKTITTKEGFISTDSILYLERQPPPAVRDTGFSVRVALTTPDFAMRGPFSEQSQILDVRSRPLNTVEIVVISAVCTAVVAVVAALLFLAVIVKVVLQHKFRNREKNLDLTAKELQHIPMPHHDNPKHIAKIRAQIIHTIYNAIKECDSSGEQDLNHTANQEYTPDQIKDSVTYIHDLVRGGLKHRQLRPCIIEKVQELVDNIIENYDEQFLFEIFKKCRSYSGLYEEILGQEITKDKLTALTEFTTELIHYLLKKKPDFRDKLRDVHNIML